MNDFWTRQDRAKGASRRLVLLLAVAVIALVAAVDGLTWMALQYGNIRGDERDVVLLVVTGGTIALIVGGALWRFIALRGGGGDVAQGLGGREVWRGQATAAERRLLDVVEEMAIASGVPVPPVYVLPEEGINACAAGYHPRDAVVCVTRGAIEHLTRDELQGVVAHEFSHILNGDMRLNLRTLCLLHGLLVVSLAGRVILETVGDRSHRRRSDEKGGGAGPILFLGLILLVVGWIGYVAGQVIRAAICRQREHLADAAGVQFTRNPSGLAGALKKILGLSRGSLMVHTAAAEASHFFFSSAIAGAWNRWLPTHPPVEERIRALDPGWDGKIPDVVSWRPAQDAPADHQPSLVQSLVSPSVPNASPAPAVIAESIGTIPPQAVAFGALLLARLPDPLRDAAADAHGAQAAILAALHAAEDPAWPHLAERDAGLAAFGQRLAGLLDQAGRVPGRLPLVQLALPSLRRLTTGQVVAFRAMLDAPVSQAVAGCALRRLVLAHLDPPGNEPVAYYAMNAVRGDLLALLGALVVAGGADPARAFAAAWRELLIPGPVPPVPPPGDLDAALARLRLANAAIKRRLVAACATAVAADGRVEPAEAELLRLVCDSLGCPLPLFADG